MTRRRSPRDQRSDQIRLGIDDSQSSRPEDAVRSAKLNPSPIPDNADTDESLASKLILRQGLPDEATPETQEAMLHAPLLVHARLAPAKPTVVFDTYWRFAAERQAVFFRRLSGAESPWSNDSILRQFKFTNAYRASDRVSQYLIREVICTGDQSPRELFFRTLLFKVFNRIETWTRLCSELGEVRYDTYSFARYDRILSDALSSGARIYSAAYIMPSGGKDIREQRKHRMHLKLIDKMIVDGLPERLTSVRQMSEAFQRLRSYPSIGDFLAYQYVTDLNYSDLTSFSESEFVIPGPGARDGIRKCFNSLGGLTEADIIRFVTDRQEEEFARLGLDFQSLWGRPLQYIDCQNLFCEVGKYARVFHPDVMGITTRSRIKQHFTPIAKPISYTYPPKWGINAHVQSWQQSHASYPTVRPGEASFWDD